VGFIEGEEYTDLADQIQASQIPCAMETIILLSVGRLVDPLQIKVRLTWIIYKNFLVPRSKHTLFQLQNPVS
jgi:hypothetical protein